MSTIKAVDKLRKNLREWVGTDRWETLGTQAEFDALADEIEAEIEEMKAFCERVANAAIARDELEVFGTAYMPLPLDADGVPVRIGDVMERVAQPGESRKVNVLKLDEYGAWWYGIEAVDMYAVEGSVHHKQRTLEDVLRDVWKEAIDYAKSDMWRSPDEVFSECAEEIRTMFGEVGR